MKIEYRRGNDLDLDQVIELYKASTLGERRPIGNRQTMAQMIKHGNLVITAWDGPKLVGISRSLTDFDYVAYLSDLAVHLDYQRRGIGKKLIEETRKAMGPESMIILLAAPNAVDYYPKIGFKHHPQAWILRSTDPF